MNMRQCNVCCKTKGLPQFKRNSATCWNCIRAAAKRERKLRDGTETNNAGIRAAYCPTCRELGIVHILYGSECEWCRDGVEKGWRPDLIVVDYVKSPWQDAHRRAAKSFMSAGGA